MSPVKYVMLFILFILGYILYAETNIAPAEKVARAQKDAGGASLTAEGTPIVCMNGVQYYSKVVYNNTYFAPVFNRDSKVVTCD